MAQTMEVEGKAPSPSLEMPKQLLFQSRLLSSLPRAAALRRDQSLTLLNLSLNILDNIVELAELFPRVQTLLLGQNRLKEIPESLATVEPLERLELAQNLIEYLPHAIFEHLSELNLKMNKIQAIPHDLGIIFPSLVYLSLQWNKLLTLPRITNNRLFKLEADQNIITSIMHPIIANSLDTMTLSCNDIQGDFIFPDGTSINWLEQIDLRMNKIERIPLKTIQQIPNLRTLMLTHNSIQQFPREMGIILKQFRDLWVSDNQLISLPDTIGFFIAQFNDYIKNSIISKQRKQERQLIDDRIDDDVILFFLSVSFQFFKSQSPLNQQSQIIPPIPDKPSLSPLINIQIGSNRLKQFPPLFLRFYQLQTLNMAHNRISELPPQLFQLLPRLNRFDISSNRLKDISNLYFAQQAEMVYADFSHNKIDRLPPRFMYMDPLLRPPAGTFIALLKTKSNIFHLLLYIHLNKNCSQDVFNFFIINPSVGTGQGWRKYGPNYLTGSMNTMVRCTSSSFIPVNSKPWGAYGGLYVLEKEIEKTIKDIGGKQQFRGNSVQHKYLLNHKLLLLLPQDQQQRTNRGSEKVKKEEIKDRNDKRIRTDKEQRDPRDIRKDERKDVRRDPKKDPRIDNKKDDKKEDKKDEKELKDKRDKERIRDKDKVSERSINTDKSSVDKSINSDGSQVTDKTSNTENSSITDRSIHKERDFEKEKDKIKDKDKEKKDLDLQSLQIYKQKDKINKDNDMKSLVFYQDKDKQKDMDLKSLQNYKDKDKDKDKEKDLKYLLRNKEKEKEKEKEKIKEKDKEKEKDKKKEKEKEQDIDLIFSQNYEVIYQEKDSDQKSLMNYKVGSKDKDSDLKSLQNYKSKEKEKEKEKEKLKEKLKDKQKEKEKDKDTGIGKIIVTEKEKILLLQQLEQRALNQTQKPINYQSKDKDEKEKLYQLKQLDEKASNQPPSPFHHTRSQSTVIKRPSSNASLQFSQYFQPLQPTGQQQTLKQSIQQSSSSSSPKTDIPPNQTQTESHHRTSSQTELQQSPSYKLLQPLQQKPNPPPPKIDQIPLLPFKSLAKMDLTIPPPKKSSSSSSSSQGVPPITKESPFSSFSSSSSSSYVPNSNSQFSMPPAPDTSRTISHLPSFNRSSRSQSTSRYPNMPPLQLQQISQQIQQTSFTSRSVFDQSKYKDVFSSLDSSKDQFEGRSSPSTKSLAAPIKHHHRSQSAVKTRPQSMSIPSLSDLSGSMSNNLFSNISVSINVSSNQKIDLATALKLKRKEKELEKEKERESEKEKDKEREMQKEKEKEREKELEQQKEKEKENQDRRTEYEIKEERFKQLLQQENKTKDSKDEQHQKEKEKEYKVKDPKELKEIRQRREIRIKQEKNEWRKDALIDDYQEDQYLQISKEDRKEDIKEDKQLDKKDAIIEFKKEDNKDVNEKKTEIMNDFFKIDLNSTTDNQEDLKDNQDDSLTDIKSLRRSTIVRRSERIKKSDYEDVQELIKSNKESKEVSEFNVRDNTQKDNKEISLKEKLREKAKERERISKEIKDAVEVKQEIKEPVEIKQEIKQLVEVKQENKVIIKDRTIDKDKNKDKDNIIQIQINVEEDENELDQILPYILPVYPGDPENDTKFQQQQKEIKLKEKMVNSNENVNKDLIQRENNQNQKTAHSILSEMEAVKDKVEVKGEQQEQSNEQQNEHDKDKDKDNAKTQSSVNNNKIISKKQLIEQGDIEEADWRILDEIFEQV
ncbi:MAG: hypothetical protein EZS28_003502 [Streblomastix strix]|uniref:Leucine rich repeat protein n=1 Tax=Streblomastix strix TaxID=222440 RepID=A0A5J4X187_9EUKA|nr:MAG: hypothetical protein EZS28_003502 [Streblomastix strix]